MKTTVIKIYIVTLTLCQFLCSCEDFIEVEVPDDKIDSRVAFADDQTAMATMAGIYNQMFTVAFSSGSTRSVTFLSGLSSDNFRATTSSNDYLEFHQNGISVTNAFNENLWSSAYNIIYMANAVLEGVESSNTLSPNISRRLSGEAKFIRAFTYFYLINLYGDVPLPLTTDYRSNTISPRKDSATVYEQIVLDLEEASEFLDHEYEHGERTRINKYVAKALLARVHLYLGHWQRAKSLSSEVIDQSAIYNLLVDLDQVFLANSREAIWQLSPLARGNNLIHTEEGYIFIKTTAMNTPVSLSESFMSIWEQEDKRLAAWVGRFTDEEETYYYPYKYKIRYDNSGGAAQEYSMVLRLSEQYLIRAEANLNLGMVSDAKRDLDVVRLRAGLPQISETVPNTDAAELMQFIEIERRRELFGEWGHRWLDLKRKGMTLRDLHTLKGIGAPTAILYPIPENERLKNPSLHQNPGY